jgi:hypothetical protein
MASAFGGRGRRNKQNGYCAQGPAKLVVAWGSGRCVLASGLATVGGAEPAHHTLASMLDRIRANVSPATP